MKTQNIHILNLLCEYIYNTPNSLMDRDLHIHMRNISEYNRSNNCLMQDRTGREINIVQYLTPRPSACSAKLGRKCLK